MRGAVTILLVVLVLGCDTSSSVKPPNKNYFVKYFGGDGNQRAVGLIANDDGTFFILGNSRAATDSLQKIYLAKATALGDTVWQTTYGTVEMEARDFKVANGYIIVVANRTDGSVSDIQLIKFDLTNGKVVQNQTLQIDPSLSPTPSNEWANSLTVLNDGGFLISGYTDYVGSFVGSDKHKIDGLHLRTDANFNQKLSSTGDWNPTSGAGKVGGASNFVVNAFQASSDSTYLFGYSDGPNPPSIDEDFWVFSLDSKGLQRGVANYVVNGSNDELTHALRATQGGYLLTGLAIDNSENFSLKISKIRFDNPSFDSKKDIQYNFSGMSLGKGGSVKHGTACNASSGYFVLTNTFNTTAGNSDILLLKLDLSLQGVWANPVILGGDGDDTAAAVAELPDGHIMVLGTINLGNPPEQFKIALMKLNSAGRLSD